ncbi:hypothetical protein M0802_013838 [Mischocyttarus mexicanus]|nr:hypothetical protein M0802_013840 [Mischocyttarus mexicanus]KAI4481922.1 hypothetical protein M0802_013838 [Mischocyttarus mexicanus]
MVSGGGGGGEWWWWLLPVGLAYTTHLLFYSTSKSIVDVDEIVKLADQTGLDNTNAQDIDELLQITTGASLSLRRS